MPSHESLLLFMTAGIMSFTTYVSLLLCGGGWISLLSCLNASVFLIFFTFLFSSFSLKFALLYSLLGVLHSWSLCELIDEWINILIKRKFYWLKIFYCDWNRERTGGNCTRRALICLVIDYICIYILKETRFLEKRSELLSVTVITALVLHTPIFPFY